MAQTHFFIFGHVQCVGFRRFVLNIANKNNLTGWVRNTHEGSVEVYATGQPEGIANLVSACQKGPIFAFVNNIIFSDDKNIPLTNNNQGGASFFIWR